MKKYKVEFTQTEEFMVDVFAKDEKTAVELAEKSFKHGDYQDMGNLNTETGIVYDVTDTDDPFYPVNK